jgi:hypothetical protein
MRQVFEKEETEALLLVDAENAFNNLNRKAALHNIKELCPPFFKYLNNTYGLPAEMIVNDQEKMDIILSEEGSTQGDVTAMGMYAVAIRPLIDILADKTDTTKCQQVWYADDSSAGGKIHEIRNWWDILNEAGPKYGYFPKPSKTILIVKDPELVPLAENVFSQTGIKITHTGERHLGAVIGNATYRTEYVNEKIDKWVKDVEQLATLAVDEPQLAYAAYTKAMCMRWCFLQRTIPNSGQYFHPLENAISQKLIPAIIGRNINDVERRLLALPVRFGGLGIQNPTITAETEFKNSILATRNLTRIIQDQETNLNNYNEDLVKYEVARLKAEKEESFIADLEQIKTLVPDNLKRCIEHACEKGAGVWLTALPLQNLGYVLNKQEFRDAICLRYEWKIPNTPSFCNCGKKNSVEHTLNCKLGGYVNMRHNNIRDLEATLLRPICRDVKIEPKLMPLGYTGTQSTKIEDGARPDVSAVGLWSPMERTFLDVRVIHLNSPSYIGTTPAQLYKNNENAKKREYNDRIMHVEKGSFTPLIYSTTGGMGAECTRHHKRVAELISKKGGDSYSDVVNHIRTRIRFALLRSTLVAIRGERGRGRKRCNDPAPVEDLSLNIVPQQNTYEV